MLLLAAVAGASPACAPEARADPPAGAVDVAPTARPALVLIAGGDLMAGRWQHGRWVERAGPRPLEPLTPWLSAADLCLVNLETALSPVPDRNTGAPPGPRTARGAAPLLQAPPALAYHLAAVGVDVVSLANNHSLDRGLRGLQATLASLREAGVRAVGARIDGSPFEALRLDVEGVRVSVLAATDRRSRSQAAFAAGAALDRRSFATLERTLPVRVAAERGEGAADVVVVSLHWGQELAPSPSTRQRRLATALLDAGAQVVVGHHPHVVQPIAAGAAGLVAFSLGNLLSDQRDPRTQA